MEEAQKGNSVKIHFTIRLADGSIFETTEGAEPHTVSLTGESALAAFEEAIVGMKKGEKKDFVILKQEAYGDYQKDMLIQIPAAQLPPQFKPEVGKILQMGQKEGEQFIVTVTQINQDIITLDANHPLAGKDLHCSIELIDIID